MSAPGAIGAALITRAGSPARPRGLEHALGRALTAGTLAGIALVAAGVAGMALSGVDPLSSAPRLEPARLPGDLVALRPAALVSLGLLVVIFTPSLRVAAALGGFLRGGERRMTLTAALILAVIALGVVIGVRG